MARKSSKTAHVMNLLAGDSSPSDQESSKTEAAKENMAANLAADSPETIKELTVLAQQASIQTKEDPIRPSPISIIDMTSTVPDPVAELIKQELEEKLADAEEKPEVPEQTAPLADSSTKSVSPQQTDPTDDLNTESSSSLQDSSQTDTSAESGSSLQDSSQTDTSAESGSSQQDSSHTGNSAESGSSQQDFSHTGNSAESSSSLQDSFQADLSEESSSSQQNALQTETSTSQQTDLHTSLNTETSSTEQAAPQSDAPVNGNSSVQPEPVSVQNEEQASEPEADFNYLNVMEYVVKGMVEDYLKKFDVCSCGHCKADVTALTLSNLPPKYIVVQSSAASPLLNYYASRLAPQVVVELTKACSIVRENPHH